MATPLTFSRPADEMAATLARWGMYGRWGRGKTTLIGTIPPELPTLVVNTPTENIKPISHIKHLVRTPLTEWEQMTDLFLKVRSETMVKNRKTGSWEPDPDYVSGRKKGIRVLAFDTLSRLQALAMKKRMGQDNLSPEDAYQLMLKVEKTGKGYDFWNDVGDWVAEAVRNFDTLPLHVIWMMQEDDREPKFEHSSPAITGPQLTPKALKQVMETLEIVGRLYVAPQEEDLLDLGDKKSFQINPNMKEVHWLLLGQHDRYLAKGPTHILGYAVKNPTWDKLTEALDPSKMAVPVEDDDEEIA